MKKLFVVCFFAVMFCNANCAQTKSEQKSDEPMKISLCELQNAPGDYNHKLIEVTGFLSHGFENFSIFDPNCTSPQGIWLEYGGTISSETIYCCGETAKPNRPKDLVVEEISIPLVNDDNFQSLHKIFKRKPDSEIKATVLGRFFAGEKAERKDEITWEGYGHFGCCSLFAIQQVIAVDTNERKDLDYRASTDYPEIKVGGGYQFILPRKSAKEVIELQQKTEGGQNQWRFNNPQTVAAEMLAQFLNIDEKQVGKIKQTRQAQGRFIYEWTNKITKKEYMIVVSRPYWLSFYAKDPQKVIWIAYSAFEMCNPCE